MQSDDVNLSKMVPLHKIVNHLSVLSDQSCTGLCKLNQ